MEEAFKMITRKHEKKKWVQLGIIQHEIGKKNTGISQKLSDV